MRWAGEGGQAWRHLAPERERTSQKAHLLPRCGGASGRSVGVLSSEEEAECQGRLGIRYVKVDWTLPRGQGGVLSKEAHVVPFPSGNVTDEVQVSKIPVTELIS